MLPITNQRVVHVPHSLATLAALVALILALSWDTDGAGRLGSAAEGDAAAPVTAPQTVSERREAEHDREGGTVSLLLPLVLPGGSSR